MAPLSIPAELKKITPFIRRAEELDRDRSSPESRLVAYYCRQYAVSQGIPAAGSSPDAKECLSSLLKSLEEEKPAMSNFTRDEAAYVCRSFANRIFDKADAEDRDGNASRDTAKTFYAAASFLQVLEQFFTENDTSEEVAEDKKRIIYAKWKATDILKALKEGRSPTPGGYGEEGDDSLQDNEDTDMTNGAGRDAPAVETVTDADEMAGLPPPVPMNAPVPPPVAPPPLLPPKAPTTGNYSSPTRAQDDEKEENDEEGTEVQLVPPPAYNSVGEYGSSDSTVVLPPTMGGNPPPRSDRPPMSFGNIAPPMPPPPSMLTPPSADEDDSISKSRGLFGFNVGNNSKPSNGGKVSKTQLADATELTKFALSALESRETDLAAERLKQALKALGR